MKIISILNPKFKEIIETNKFEWEWLSPTGISMQNPDIMDYKNNKWLNLKALGLYEKAKVSPNAKVYLQLLSSCHRSFSKCKLKSLKIRVWMDKK